MDAQTRGSDEPQIVEQFSGDDGEEETVVTSKVTNGW